MNIVDLTSSKGSIQLIITSARRPMVIEVCLSMYSPLKVFECLQYPKLRGKDWEVGSHRVTTADRGEIQGTMLLGSGSEGSVTWYKLQ